MIKKIISLLFLIGIAIFFIYQIYANSEGIKSFPWKFNNYYFFLLVLSLLPIYFLNAYSWFLLNKAFGVDINYKQSLKIWIFSNISRFLPGSIWQYIGRVYLSSQYGIPKKTSSMILVLESLFTLYVGVVIILLSLLISNFTLDQNLIRLCWIIFIVSPLFLFFLTSKPRLTRISIILSKITKRDIEFDHTLPKAWIPILFLSFAVQFFVDGLALYFLINLATPLSVSLIPIIIAIFACSWILGYISFFAPSGLGIQELSIAGLLSFFMPFPLASVIAIVFRLLLISTELLTFLVVFLGNKSQK